MKKSGHAYSIGDRRIPVSTPFRKVHDLSRFTDYTVEDIDTGIVDLDICDDEKTCILSKGGSIWRDRTLIRQPIVLSNRCRTIRCRNDNCVALDIKASRPVAYVVSDSIVSEAPLSDYIFDVEDIAVTSEYAVVAYGDMGPKGPVAYDLNTGAIRRYHKQFYEEISAELLPSCSFLNCITTFSDTAYFFPAGEEQLVAWNLSTMECRAWNAPPETGYVRAISVGQDAVYFYRVREHNHLFYRWNIDAGQAELVAEFKEEDVASRADTKGGPVRKIRGLPGGKFLLVRSDGYSILDLS